MQNINSFMKIYYFNILISDYPYILPNICVLWFNFVLSERIETLECTTNLFVQYTTQGSWMKNQIGYVFSILSVASISFQSGGGGAQPCWGAWGHAPDGKFFRKGAQMLHLQAFWSDPLPFSKKVVEAFAYFRHLRCQSDKSYGLCKNKNCELTDISAMHSIIRIFSAKPLDSEYDKRAVAAGFKEAIVYSCLSQPIFKSGQNKWTT